MRERYLCQSCCVLFVWFVLMGIFGGKAGESSPVPEGQTLQVYGTVYRQEITKTDQRVYLKNISFDSDTAGFRQKNNEWKKKKIVIYLKEPQELEPGNRVLARGICAYPQAARNPGCFDARAYYGAKQIGMFLKKATVLRCRRTVYPLRSALMRLQNFCRRQMEQCLEEKEAGILSAMLLGDRAALDRETKNLYQDAGIFHLLAISGLHISLTGMCLYRVLRKIHAPFQASALLSFGAMAAYAFMAGSVSAIRAVFMFGMFLLSQVTGRTYDLPTALAAAAACILTWASDMITQAGFLLSFAAVGGVLLASCWESRLLCRTAAGVSLAVSLFTAMPVAFFYYQLPLYAVLLNLCILPLMPFVLGFGIAGTAASVCSKTLGSFLLAPAHYLIRAITFLCEKVCLLPFSTIVTGKPGIFAIAVYYLALALIFRGFAAWKRRPAFWKGGFTDAMRIAAAGCLLAVCFTVPGRADFTMTFLDVGQGDGCCIQNARRSVWMIDGGSSTQEQVAQYCIEPFLKSKGIGRVDYWLLSHSDADHSGGLYEILRTYVRGTDGKNAAGITVGTILLADIREDSERREEICSMARRLQIPVRLVRRGANLADGDLNIKILGPKKTAYEDSNASSVVALVKYQGFSALMTGDVEGSGEKELLEDGVLEDVDLLKAAHHGSGHTTSGEFLKKTKPEVTVISCGKGNRYGHPHAELLERLAKYGSKAVRTDEHGAVILTVNENGYRIRGWQN